MLTNRHSERGFSLIEALVALGVFAMAAVGLISLQAQTTRVASDVQSMAMAQLGANAAMVEISAQTTPPKIGKSTVETVILGRTWIYGVDVTATPEPSVLRVQIAMRPSPDGAATTQMLGFVAGEGGAR